MAHIEIKARKYIDGTQAQKIIDKGTVIAVLTTGTISQPAKDKFDEANIAWCEKVSEQEFMESEAKEEE